MEPQAQPGLHHDAQAHVKRAAGKAVEDPREAPHSVADRLLRKAIDRARALRHFPESTYRLQFHAGFTFDDAAAVSAYLGQLGVTHAYASPYLKARPGSTHGYDVIDHRTLNPELGGAPSFDAWLDSLRRHGLHHVLDTVPNHVGVATNDNVWWNDVLENGPASRYGRYFDIAWTGPPRPELHGRVLLPLLGEPYADVLENGQLQLRFEPDTGSFAVFYYDRRFPIAPCSYARILGYRTDRLSRDRGEDDHDLVELLSIATAARNLPDRNQCDPDKVGERHREKEVVKRRLADLVRRSSVVRQFVDENLRTFNGTPGEPRTFNLLDDLLSHQCYRLSFWGNASDEINYRRFFDVNDLAALAMERPEVFEDTHAFILRLLVEGKIAGLRIDHPDGLFDPAQYLARLQRHFLLACAQWVHENDATFQREDAARLTAALLARLPEGEELRRLFDAPGWPLYVVAEKILAVGEPLVASWPVHGTSGYDFLNRVNGLFVDPAGERPLTDFYRELTGDDVPFEDLVYQKKRLILETSLASELHMLAHQLDRLAQRDRHWRDFTFRVLRDSLREVIACFPVYRSYIAGDAPSETDRRQVQAAIDHATRRNPSANPAAFRFIRDALLQSPPEGSAAGDLREALRQFAGKFQQVTSPATAKGVEDTAFYVYQRLISLNEVGGDPGKFGFPPDEVHAYFSDRQARWPYALSALSTHDTKRSEDVRARINVLAEIPDDWRRHVTRWRDLNAPHRQVVHGHPVPAPDEEYLIYQTLVGAWPLEPSPPQDLHTFVQRVQAYMEKAMREAKLRTSWTAPDEAYEGAVKAFVERIADADKSGAFLDDFRPFQRRVSEYGLVNSLAQTVLRLTAPGVPDTYQGTELWDFSLVDPDNRRPVDYELRRRLLGDVEAATASALDLSGTARRLWQSRADGKVKLLVTSRALKVRTVHPGLFTLGEYLPARADGRAADHVFAFARRHEGRHAVVIVPRRVASLGIDPADPEAFRGAFGATRVLLTGIPNGIRLRDVFSGRTLAADAGAVDVASALADLPVALVVQE